MPSGSLAIKRQIKSTTNTKKMTKAMELVSASKMRKSIGAVLSARPYADAATELLAYLAPRADKKLHVLLQERKVKRVGVILISSNRGLCGGFNANLSQAIGALAQEEKDHGAESVELFTLGRRGREYASRSGHTITADFLKSDVTRSVVDIMPLIHTVVEKFEKGELDKVMVVYTHFYSTMRQKPVTFQLVPFSAPDFSPSANQRDFAQFLFEPTDAQVLSYILPRLLETKVYKAVLESEASEHSARMMAMHNASESATDLLFDLQLSYNQARQAAITQEIAEISSGRAALE